MKDRFAILWLIVAGLYTNRWLRGTHPWTQHSTVRYLMYISVLSTIFWSDSIMVVKGLTLVFFSLALGFVLSDFLAMSKKHSDAEGDYGQAADAERATTPPGGSTLSTTNEGKSRADSIENLSSTQGIKEAPQDENNNPANNATDAATFQQATEETKKPLKDEQHSHDEVSDDVTLQKAIAETEAMHNKRKKIIDGAAPNALNRFEARSKPNQRLVTAFRVNNCFTKDEERCEEFRGHVMKLLQPANPANPQKHWRDWFELVEAARTVTKSVFSVPGHELNLSDAIHLIVLKTMLKVLFGRSPTDTSKDRQILELAKGVNQQWMDSKNGVTPGETPAWDFERQGRLKAVAEEIFGPWDADNIKNPFNKILPGYETMWRVVLRCVLEVSSSRHPSTATEAWKERLALFIQNPTRNQLQSQKNHEGLTVEHISFEVLRLYPPTRHVARLQQDLDGDGERIQTADIEEIHHTAPLWSPDPMSFRPERWINLSKGMNTKGFMPFGEFPFRCPARQHMGVEIPFGVTMIAVLTACFIEAMADEWSLDEQNIPSISKPLCNGRTSYANVSLRRIKSSAADITSNVVNQPMNTTTDKTDARNTDAHNIDDHNTDDLQTGAHNADDHKTDGELNIESNEMEIADGEDEKQLIAAQQ